jgi:hypothetical protein
MDKAVLDHVRYIVFEGEHIRLEYNGPKLEVLKQEPHPRVVIAFAPFDYPFQTDAGGWGSASFTKREIAHVCVFHSAEDWHQNDEFFPAMQACRAFLGDGIAVTTYGFSMGGFGALLGAQSLEAERAIAISPQVSIDPSKARFERRYAQQWAAMGDWKHDLSKHMRSQKTDHIVLFDPLHKQDKKHEARLPKSTKYTRCLLHGAGHAGIQCLVEMKAQEVLFDLLRGTATAADLRKAYRANRRKSFRYLRKVGTILHEKKRPAALGFFEIAKSLGYRRLIKKWRPFYE